MITVEIIIMMQTGIGKYVPAAGQPVRNRVTIMTMTAIPCVMTVIG